MSIKLQRENEALRERIRELESRLEEMYWCRFYECPKKENGYRLPIISDEVEACEELEKMGKLVKHDKMYWWRIK
jgi:hypothetical protein